MTQLRMNIQNDPERNDPKLSAHTSRWQLEIIFHKFLWLYGSWEVNFLSSLCPLSEGWKIKNVFSENLIEEYFVVILLEFCGSFVKLVKLFSYFN